MAIAVQLIIRHQVGNQISLPIEPYLAPGLSRIGIIVVIGTGTKDIGIPGVELYGPAVYFHITGAL